MTDVGEWFLIGKSVFFIFFGLVADTSNHTPAPNGTVMLRA